MFYSFAVLDEYLNDLGREVWLHAQQEVFDIPEGQVVEASELTHIESLSFDLKILYFHRKDKFTIVLLHFWNRSRSFNWGGWVHPLIFLLLITVRLDWALSGRYWGLLWLAPSSWLVQRLVYLKLVQWDRTRVILFIWLNLYNLN